ncbi:tetratricopeptide repeat protein [Horticoccus sp. 23ND18S-11]|uniref:tetratricopeptide repeat protein n=1 Tax=Horticoccus sp. 23ND18S-11 TaxID=3391832 RepID=UPI0039C94210
MNRPVPHQPSCYVVATGIALAAALTYANTFAAPFIFDDIASIVNNPTIRSLWPLGPVLSPPHTAGATVGGRPLLNLTLAFNHALSGQAVWSYHALNLLIHALAGLALFGVVRRSLANTRFAGSATTVAGWTALLWTVHPVQTESVTYIVQRAESLSGLLYLSTLYAFIRGSERTDARGWFAVSVFTCFLGMATKEVMATAPVMILAYDRAFRSGTIAGALRQRPWYYAALVSSWVLLGILMAGNDGRGGTAGLDVGVTPWAYAITQIRAVPHYLGVAFKPYPLMIDHGGLLPFDGVLSAAPYAFALGALVAGTLFAFFRWPRWGFAGLWFLGILAPSSSVVPLLDSIFEHRTYLSLAAPLVVSVLAVTSMLGAHARIALCAIAVALGLLTLHRNTLYQSDVALWTDNVVRKPNNARARFELGNVFLLRGEFPAAIASYRSATRLNPTYVEARNNLGSSLLLAGRPAEALPELETALQLHPIAETHFAAGRCLAELGRGDAAIAHFDAGLKLRPADPDALFRRANLHLQAGQFGVARAGYRGVLALVPNFLEAEVNLTSALLADRQLTEAATHAENAVRLNPQHAVAHWKLGQVRFELEDLSAAIVALREALRLDPNLVAAQHLLARALTQNGQYAEALGAYERTLQLAPDLVPARYNAALVLEHLEQWEPAAAQLEYVLRLQPDFPEAARRLEYLRQRLNSKRIAVPLRP